MSCISYCYRSVYFVFVNFLFIDFIIIWFIFIISLVPFSLTLDDVGRLLTAVCSVLLIQSVAFTLIPSVLSSQFRGSDQKLEFQILVLSRPLPKFRRHYSVRYVLEVRFVFRASGIMGRFYFNIFFAEPPKVVRLFRYFRRPVEPSFRDFHCVIEF